MVTIDFVEAITNDLEICYAQGGVDSLENVIQIVVRHLPLDLTEKSQLTECLASVLGSIPESSGITDNESVERIAAALEAGNLQEWEQVLIRERDRAFASYKNHEKQRSVPFGIRVCQPSPIDVLQFLKAVVVFWIVEMRQVEVSNAT